ncbi:MULTISPECIES: dimethylarginine dimethylaminohydrolase family protein [Actinomyces]|uniref:dimethylarginine dimethylaminohydrolase family protein n=1 Tax=Actinomyces TaxID=1654 RepID=UPI0010A25BB8|nr:MULTISPECIES: arginine deiminase family protein [Actinomyces]MDO4900270.1 arginine deiminase family protein [Actinomyces sp.]
MIQVHNPSDIAPLKEVVVGPYKRFGWWPLVRETLRSPNPSYAFYLSKNTVSIPDHDIAEREHAQFVSVLRESGVVVHTLGVIDDVSVQLYPRDIAFAVDDVLFLARSADPVRRREQRALYPLLAEVSRVVPLDDGHIEGGDVIVTDDVVLVGLSEATDLKGVGSLRQAFARAGIDREIIPIEFSHRGVVHLDTKLTLVGPGLGYIYSPALTPRSRERVAQHLELIEATEAETLALMVNTFALAPDHIVIDERATRLERELRSRGITPVPLKFSEVTRFPGGFRCATLPLIRRLT